VDSVTFLGFIIEKVGVRADPVKVKAVVEWPVPSSCTVTALPGICKFF